MTMDTRKVNIWAFVYVLVGMHLLNVVTYGLTIIKTRKVQIWALFVCMY